MRRVASIRGAEKLLPIEVQHSPPYPHQFPNLVLDHGAVYFLRQKYYGVHIFLHDVSLEIFSYTRFQSSLPKVQPRPSQVLLHPIPNMLNPDAMKHTFCF